MAHTSLAPRLRGKLAIITGAAHGIGRAIAERFAAEAAHVIIVDLEAKAGAATTNSIRQSGGDAQFFRCDVSSKTQVVAMMKRVRKFSGKIDILVNNAAYIARVWHNAGETPTDEWSRCMEVALLGTHLVTQATIPLMMGSGSIINISSVQGLVAGRNSAAYTTAKHGLVGFTRSVACDYGPKNIRCNAICPGAIRTRISPKPGSELHQRQVSKTFLGRVGDPIEVAHAALFLASDESSYVTGAVLAVDGGWTAM